MRAFPFATPFRGPRREYRGKGRDSASTHGYTRRAYASRPGRRESSHRMRRTSTYSSEELPAWLRKEPPFAKSERPATKNTGVAAAAQYPGRAAQKRGLTTVNKRFTLDAVPLESPLRRSRSVGARVARAGRAGTRELCCIQDRRDDQEPIKLGDTTKKGELPFREATGSVLSLCFSSSKKRPSEEK